MFIINNYLKCSIVLRCNGREKKNDYRLETATTTKKSKQNEKLCSLAESNVNSFFFVFSLVRLRSWLVAVGLHTHSKEHTIRLHPKCSNNLFKQINSKTFFNFCFSSCLTTRTRFEIQWQMYREAYALCILFVGRTQETHHNRNIDNYCLCIFIWGKKKKKKKNKIYY